MPGTNRSSATSAMMAAMKRGDQISIAITDVDVDGHGLAVVDERTLKVCGTAVGDQADIHESLKEIGTLARQHEITGKGQAVSVAFVGRYDRETREVDVSGNLVPASFFSQIIGAIPLVGEILTGVDNAGLFVTQFSMTGNIDDPDSSVTAASIVPGVLRDLFSPAWIRREGDRILGPDANEANGG